MNVQGEPHTLFADGWRWVRAYPLHAPLGAVDDAPTVSFNAADARAAQVQRELATGSYAPLHAVRQYLQNTPGAR